MRGMWLTVVVASACAAGGTSTQTTKVDSPVAPRGWLVGAYPEDLSPATHVIAAAAGATREQACEGARAQLVKALSGREAHDELAAILRARGRERHAVEDGQQICLLAAERTALLSALSGAIEQSTPAEDAVLLQQAEALAFDAELRFWLNVLATARARDELCAIAKSAGGPACAPLSCLALVEAQLSTMAVRIALERQPARGIPYLTGLPAYAPLTIRVLAHPRAGSEAPVRPVAGVPLSVLAPPDLVDATAVVTDARGEVRLALRRAPTATDVVAIEIDRVRLLGEAGAAVWPDKRLPITLRRLRWDELQLVLDVRSPRQPRDALVGAARAQLEAALAAKLPGASLKWAGPAKSASAADDSPDVSIAVEVDWAFSSALSGRSVWYEATASLKVRNAWNDETLLQIDERAQEAGIGEGHAAKQAVGKLCGQLADKIAAQVKAAFPTGESPSAAATGAPLE